MMNPGRIRGKHTMPWDLTVEIVLSFELPVVSRAEYRLKRFDL